MTGYLDVLRKGWAWIFALVVLGGCAGYAIALNTTKVYQASAQVFVAMAGSSNPDVIRSSDQYAIGMAQSLPAFANSPMVAGPVIRQLGLHISISDLAGKITTDAPAGKVLINIRVKDNDPIMAARLTNAITARFIEVTRWVSQPTPTRRPQFELTTVHPATVPTNPVSPDRQLFAEVGLLAGLALGVIAVSLGGVRRANPEQPAQAATS